MRMIIVREGDVVEERPKRSGYVYVVCPVGHNAYKIGRTVDLKSRMARMQRNRSIKLEYVLTVWSNDYEQLEERLIEKYQPLKLDGDWFALSESDIEYIRGLAA